MEGQRRVLFDLPMAAAYIGRSVKALRHLIRDGEIPAKRHRRRMFVRVADLDLFIESLPAVSHEEGYISGPKHREGVVNK